MELQDAQDLRGQLMLSAQLAGIRLHRVRLVLKRFFDVIGALLGLIVIGPLLLLLALLIRRESPGPAIFTQQRVGQWGRSFTLYKLRTMVQGAERQGAGLAIVKEDPRITRLGGILRKLSLDELPQYLNVLKGDMSFVGPRPLPVAYLDRWNDRQKLRLLMPQGISGWSQVVARNDAPWPERLERDVEYARNWSLWFDLRIVFLTIWKIVGRSGVSTSEGTVEEFRPEAGAGDTKPAPRGPAGGEE
jgi:lipopolysaccharide/colanic/teichoic acid biosynthesis glycosyltransferase